jgi:TM2 domain-containing membrane protein YozV
MNNELPPVEKPQRLVITENSLLGESPGSSAGRPPYPGMAAPLPAPAPAFAPPAGLQVPLPAVLAPKPPVMGGSFCSACGSAIDPRAVVCPRCGVAGGGALAATAAMASLGLERKSPGVAILLSLVFTGAGQVYCGRPGRGALFFLAAVLSGVLILALVGLFLLPIVWIWAAVDANNLATAQNRRLLQGMGLAG